MQGDQSFSKWEDWGHWTKMSRTVYGYIAFSKQGIRFSFVSEITRLNKFSLDETNDERPYYFFETGYLSTVRIAKKFVVIRHLALEHQPFHS